MSTQTVATPLVTTSAHVAEKIINSHTTSRMPAETKKGMYQPGLDALRFMAFLAIFGLHAVPTTEGSYWALLRQASHFGLSLFFFLSAYLITCLLEVEKVREGRAKLKMFYVRRSLRILPLYITYLLGAWLLEHFTHLEKFSPWLLASMLLMVGNLGVQSRFAGSNMVAHLWSISTEEQFYLIWPAVSNFLTSLQLKIFCASLCVCSLGFTYVWSLVAPNRTLWYNSVTESLFFAAGGLMALQIGIVEQKKSIWKPAVCAVIGFSLWIVAQRLGFMSGATPARISLSYLLVAISCALLLWGTLQIPHRCLPRPLLYLGKISYGLYVFHGLVLVSTRHIIGHRLPPVFLLGIQLGLTILLAAISYQCFERRFLAIKKRFEVVRTDQVSA